MAASAFGLGFDFPVHQLLKATKETPKVYPKVSNLPEIKPITIKPETKIFELKTQINLLEQGLNENPVRKLAKYANKNGELPEVLGGIHAGSGGATSKFGISGDDIAKTAGFDTSEEARIAYEQYRKSNLGMKGHY